MSGFTFGAEVIVIADLNTTGSFLFSKPQTHIDYPVVLNPIKCTGAPPLNAFIPIDVQKTTTGFVVTVGAAPGLGNSITFELGITFKE